MKTPCRALLAASIVLALQSHWTGARAQDAIPSGDWRLINRDLTATRFSPLDEVNKTNVARLNHIL